MIRDVEVAGSNPVIPTNMPAFLKAGFLLMTYTVYILQSVTTRRFYVGQTYDLEKRLQEHNSELAGHTRKEQPWQVVWHQVVQTRSEALSLEKKIKKRGAQRFLHDLQNAQPGSVTPRA